MSKKQLYEWMKKLHMYAGLLTFTAFVVWGVTGVHGAFTPAPGEFTPPPVSSEKEVPFRASGTMDDKALAKAIYEAVQIPAAGGHYNIHRDADANLAFTVFSINGGRDVTYLEKEGKVRLAHRVNSVWSYLSSMHTAHSRRHNKVSASAVAWGVFNEFSNWAFLFMTLSGVYLWVGSRPGLRWARILFGGAVAVTAVLWMAIR
jgi:hypothetical protein